MNSNTVHTLNTGTELFVDDALIASKHGVKRTLHQCVKHDVPVLNLILIIHGSTADQISPDVCTSTALRCTMPRTENIGCGTCVAWDRIGGLKRT